MNTPIRHRHFLRSASALIALPALESLGFRRFASAANAATTRPKRAVFLNFGWGPHDMSHYTPGDRMEASHKRDLVQSELLASLIEKLKATKEPDGTSLFDHTALAYGSNIRTIHYLDNCPTLIAGGGAGLQRGQHLFLPKNTPLANVSPCSTASASIPNNSNATATARAW